MLACIISAWLSRSVYDQTIARLPKKTLSLMITELWKISDDKPGYFLCGLLNYKKQ